MTIETEKLPERHRKMLLEHHAKFGCGADPGANAAECTICKILIERPCPSKWKPRTFEGTTLELTCRAAEGHAGSCRARVAREVLGTAAAVEFVWPFEVTT
jgi:hypothetical protein